MPEKSPKNLEEEDDSCANDIEEPNNNGKSEQSENVNSLKGMFVTTVKEVSAGTKTRKEDLDNAQVDDGQDQKEINELKQDKQADLHIEEHIKPDNQAECVTDQKKTKLKEETVVEEQSPATEDKSNFEEESGEDAVTDQIDHIAGEHSPFNLFLFPFSSRPYPFEPAGFFVQYSSSKEGWKLGRK